MLWPDEVWPQDIGALAVLDGAPGSLTQVSPSQSRPLLPFWVSAGSGTILHWACGPCLALGLWNRLGMGRKRPGMPEG